MLRFKDIATQNKRPFLKLILILLIIVVAFFTYAYNKGMSIYDINIRYILSVFNNAEENDLSRKTLEFKYETDFKTVFTAYNNCIIKVTKDNIECFDKKGNSIWKDSILANNPLVKAVGNYILVADLDGNNVVLFKNSKKEWDKKIKNQIQNADLNKNGFVTVIHDEERAKSAVTVFNSQGMEQLTIGKAEHFILLSQLSFSGKKLVLNCIGASGIRANSLLEFNDIYGKLLASSVPHENLIFSNMWLVNDDSLFAVGTKMAVYYDDENRQKWKKPVDEGIFGSGIIDGKYLVLAQKSKEKSTILRGQKTDLIVLDKKGKIQASCTIDDGVVNICTFGDVIAANTGREVYIVNGRGKLLNKIASKKDILYVKFLNRNEIIMVTKSSYIVTELN